MDGITDMDEGFGAEIRARLDAVLGDARVSSGTLIAHMLHDLFLSEGRQLGQQPVERKWLALDAAGIEEAGREFCRLAWWPKNAGYVLPAGTVATGGIGGCPLVGSELLGFDVDRPGLHDIDDLPVRPGGLNLTRLLHYIDELSRKLPCRAIGMPSLVDRFDGRYSRDYLQFSPFAPAGDVVLQRDMNFVTWGDFFCAMPDDMIRRLASEVVEDMRYLWSNARTFTPDARATRDAAARITFRLRDVRVHAVTIDISRQLAGGVRFGVEFDAWDHALRRGLVVQALRVNQGQMQGLDAGALDRADAADAVHLLGADGRIGGIARAIVNAAPQGASTVLAELAERFETVVTLPTRPWPFRVRLHWRDGEIVTASRGHGRIEVSDEGVTLRDQTLTESLLVSLPGQPLYSVFDYPFRCHSPIARIENKQGNLLIAPEPDLWLLNCRSGQMWPER